MARKLINVEVKNQDNYPVDSRYKGTKYFQREIREGVLRIEPETWKPVLIPESDEDKQTVVDAGEEGRLDLVALRVYNNSALWWIIAFANDIIDPFTEVKAGLLLRYPPFSFISGNILI